MTAVLGFLAANGFLIYNNRKEMIDQFMPIWQIESDPWYNCSKVMPEGPAWSAKDGRPNIGLGIWCITFGVVCEVLYAPCQIAIYSQIRHSCYKIMMFLGMIDMAALALNSIATGFFFLAGEVFCTRPRLNYILGAIALGLWCAACFTCLILVLNRLLDIFNRNKNSWLFDGNRTWALLCLPFVYGVYFCLFTPPLLFNSAQEAWFFDPFIQQEDDHNYVNYIHTSNNLLIVVCTCILYGILCGSLVFQKHKHKGNIANKPIFIQSSLICFVNLVAALIYVYMQFFPTPGALIVCGHICWQLGHGCPAIIYLVLNRTIQRRVLMMFGLSRHNPKVQTISNGAMHSNSEPHFL